MLGRFTSFITGNNLCSENDKILLAVSGGIDSIVMLDLFVKAGYICAIANCNFNLRGEESDQDLLFVKKLSEEHNIPFFTTSFNTGEYADNNRISIQMAARLLRYEWFEEIRINSNYDKISTAHNKNDIIETFLINLIRGTGIRGLTGIPVRSDHIIRPLLCFTREEIEKYSDETSLQWREDSSNSQTRYARNKIRHLIIPALKELNPSIVNTMTDNTNRLKEVEDIYLHSLEKARKNLVVRESDHSWISVNELKKLTPLYTWTYELVKDFDFSPHIVKDIVKNMDAESGRQFFSSTHRLVKDRNKLIIHPLKDTENKRFYIEDPSQDTEEPVRLELNILPPAGMDEIPADQSVAWFDLDLLEFPLMIRKWEPGDYFMPLGMKNMKKLSDFFIDNKFSLPEKENTWLLISGNKIAWIIGKRIDERFRISEDTRRILQFRIF